MDIDAPVIPVGQPMRGESVPPVIRTRPDPPFLWLQPFFAQQASERRSSLLYRHSMTLAADEQSFFMRCGSRPDKACTLLQPPVDLAAQILSERNNTSSTLALTDQEGVLIEVHVG